MMLPEGKKVIGNRSLLLRMQASEASKVRERRFTEKRDVIFENLFRLLLPDLGDFHLSSPHEQLYDAYLSDGVSYARPLWLLALLHTLFCFSL